MALDLANVAISGLGVASSGMRKEKGMFHVYLVRAIPVRRLPSLPFPNSCANFRQVQGNYEPRDPDNSTWCLVVPFDGTALPFTDAGQEKRGKQRQFWQ